MSYNSIEECDLYVKEHYLTTDPVYIRWKELDTTGKQILLNKAFDIIEALPFTGRKTVAGQPKAFPRCPYTEVPYEVKAAECEQALAFSDTENTAAFDDYRKMIQYGIQSYRVGNFSESLLNYSKNSVEMQYGVSSPIAMRLLTPWLSGGYTICHA